MKAAGSEVTEPDPTMIHTIAKKAQNTGFTVLKPLEDHTGTYSYLLSYEGETFFLVTKEYAYKGLASFMAAVVDEAADQGASLIFYEDADESTHVFDALYVRECGQPSSGPSKTQDTDWVEIELDEGCRLGAYMNGTARPQTTAGDNATLAEF